MGKYDELVKKVVEYTSKSENIRNIGIIAHVDHGKTTLTDNLMAASGVIAQQLAGEQLFTDSYELEQQRGITIFSAAASILYNYKDKPYVINLIDTPGHVDFVGEVIRAMRVIDGAVLVVDAVEGIMPQTENVLRIALKEYVRPILFINKVDRLIKELRADMNTIREKFEKIIVGVNELIRKYAPDEFKSKWQVNPATNSVIIGSAYRKWGFSIRTLQEKGLTFQDVYNLCLEGKDDELAEKIPLHEAICEGVIDNIPNPVEAQKYRIPHLWPGDLNSEVGKAMINCDVNGPTVFVVSKVEVDPQAGEVVIGRVFSGKLTKGMDLYLCGKNVKQRAQQLCMFIGPHRVMIDSIPAGSIVGVIGFKEIQTGDTLATNPDATPFQELATKVEPVVTVKVEPKNPQDGTKLMNVLRKLAKEDIALKVYIDKDTGEYIISGMGELHLEIVKHRIEVDNKIPINMSAPTVLFRESVSKKSEVFEGKSQNKHNKFYIYVEPMNEELLKAINEGEIPEGRFKTREEAEVLTKYGLSREEAKGAWAISKGCIFIDVTKGIQYLNETKELIIQAFEEATKDGPLARENMMGVKVYLVDAVLHEDAVHRGPAQVIPAVKRAIYAAFLSADPYLLEPKMLVTIKAPEQYMGGIQREIQSRRGQILETDFEDDLIVIKAKIPTKEMSGFANALRSAAQGRVTWAYQFAGYERVPKELQDKFIQEIRERKGLPPEPPKPEDFME